MTSTFIRRLLALALIFCIVVAIAAAVLRWLEGWSMVDAVYVAVMTLTTIGFGDAYVLREPTKLFITVYALISIPLFLMSITVVGEALLARYHAQQVRRKLTGQKRS